MNGMRNTCAFIAFLWLADVASDIAKSGHPFWSFLLGVCLLCVGFLYIVFVMVDDDDDEAEDGDAIEIKIATLDDLFRGADYQTAQVTTVGSNDMKRLRQEYEVCRLMRFHASEQQTED